MRAIFKKKGNFMIKVIIFPNYFPLNFLALLSRYLFTIAPKYQYSDFEIYTLICVIIIMALLPLPHPHLKNSLYYFI